MVPKSLTNKILVDQLIRSGTSVGANYLEANDSLGKKDFIFRLRISRKECKESRYWLKLLKENNPDHIQTIEPLIKESTEIKNILSTIISKSS